MRPKKLGQRLAYFVGKACRLTLRIYRSRRMHLAPDKPTRHAGSRNGIDASQGSALPIFRNEC
jgi:hypothetical protein